MPANEGATGLAGYRVLDLTDDRGYLCGKILGDLGADVIKVEPPGGDPGRLSGPFYHDEVNPERSLLWWAYNTSKRGITLELATSEGRDAFLDLVRKSDFVIESYTPGYMKSIGLGYETLRKANPGLIMVSISAFGQEGSYSHLKAPDIVIQAMGGYMNLVGDLDRAPLRISVPQAYLHASNDAATGALIALYHRERTGTGQRVDVSAQECVLWTGFSNYPYWDFRQVSPVRGNVDHTGLTVLRPKNPDFFSCKDGYVLFTPNTGRNGNRTRRFIDWMVQEGWRDEFLETYPWEASQEELLGRPPEELTEEERETFALQQIEKHREIKDRCSRFLLTRTKVALWEEAVIREYMLGPINNMREVLDDRHFKAREVWCKLDHPEVKASVTYPGAPFISTGTPYVLRRPAPLIGEHNSEILNRELGYPRQHALVPRDRPADEKDVFKGLKILDFSWVTVGPRATRYFADHGATVVKVEAPERSDVGRLLPPFKDQFSGSDRSGWFALYNLNKYGITIDLTKPEGLDIARQLVKWADVLVESFRPGVMKKFGLDYENARKLNQSIIYASTAQFGQDGPYSAFGGYGYHAAAMCGFDDLTGWPDRMPNGAFWAYTDHVAPQYLATAITTALLHRRRTGQGQYIDQSQNESAVQFLIPSLLDCEVNGRIARRDGNRDPHAAPHGAYRCLGDDRWCVIAVFTEEEWRTFCRVAELHHLVKDRRFATLETRKDNEDELDRIVETWTVRHKAPDMMRLLQENGVPAAVVQTSEDLHNDPQIQLRRHYWNVDHPIIGPHPVDAQSFRLSQTPAQVYMREPLLGEHNATVCLEILGMDGEELARCMEAGAFGQV